MTQPTEPAISLTRQPAELPAAAMLDAIRHAADKLTDGPGRGALRATFEKEDGENGTATVVATFRRENLTAGGFLEYEIRGNLTAGGFLDWRFGE